ncbi:MAG: FAD:protein FMN transferase [Desulfobulbaceae bacterium]|nr:FAD:protein FMN transferase [Desulfobulbaceae bacterium]
MKTLSPAPSDQKRRSFLKFCGLLGLGTAGAALLPLEKAETVLFGKKEYKVSKTKLSMGSFLAITIVHPSRDEAENAMGLAFDEVDRLSKILSRHDPSTPIAHLNQTGSLTAAPPEVMDVVSRALYYNRVTNGAFDITVQPVVDLYKNSFAAGHKPTEGEITNLLPRIGSEHVRVSDNTISFERPNMGVTLDGIAPGYIVDRVSALLVKLGVSNHLINCSGDIRTSGSAANAKQWTVAIQDPNHQKAYPDIVSMGTGAISTSGNYEIFYDKEKTFHHIVTPKTGHSPLLATSVTTSASSLMEADALATGMMVMTPVESLNLMAQHTNCQCFIIGRDNTTTHSAGWSSSFA